MAYADVLGALGQGQQFVDGLFQQQARRQAGGQLARGDTAGAARTAYGFGDLATGNAIQDRGAAQAAATRTRETEDRARNLGIYRNALDVVERSAPQGPEAALSAFEQAVPGLRVAGADDATLDQLRTGLRTNTAEALAIMRAAVGREELELRDGGAGDVVGVNKRTGAAQLLYDAPDRPISTPYGIILPPNSRTPVASGTQPPSGANGLPAVTGPAISGGALWSRQEQQESGGRQSAVSPVGAFGVAQLMPETAAELARQMGVTPAQLRSDENLNRQAGQMYMDQQLAKYDGNEALALAAYNAGPGRVDEWIQRFGDPRTGEITTEEFVARIPFRETQNYVQNITRGQSGGAPVAQGDGSQMDGAQELGGGWSLQQMQTPAEIRQAEENARRAQLDERRDRREEGRYQRETSGALTPAQQASQSAQTFTQERQLRTEFGNNPAVKTLATVRPQVQIIGDIARRANAGERISAADDLALIFSYMKMLDPGSVVREGEFANAQNTAGVPERVVNAYNRALDGTRLSDSQRNEFFRSATGVMQGYQDSYNEVVNRQRGLAESYGLNADRIAPETPTRPRADSPRIRFTPTEAQTQASQAIVAARGGASAARGTTTNPILINPADPRGSYGNVRAGQYYLDPTGTLRQRR